jgi:hypothetical protein
MSTSYAIVKIGAAVVKGRRSAVYTMLGSKALFDKSLMGNVGVESAFQKWGRESWGHIFFLIFTSCSLSAA